MSRLARDVVALDRALRDLRPRNPLPLDDTCYHCDGTGVVARDTPEGAFVPRSPRCTRCNGTGRKSSDRNYRAAGIGAPSIESTPAPTSKEAMWREFLDANQTLLDATDLDRVWPPTDDPKGYAIFDPVERWVGVKARRAMRSFHEAFLASVRSKPGKRPRWTDVRLGPLQEIVDLVGVPSDCPRSRLVLPYDATAKSRGRASDAERAELAAQLAALGLTFDEALDELRKERATGAHAFVSRNLVLDRLWRNIQAHLDALGPEGSPERAAFLATLDPRRMTGGSRSRASKFLVARAMELNPATGDFLFDERSRVRDVLPANLERPEPETAEREPGSDDEGDGVPF